MGVEGGQSARGGSQRALRSLTSQAVSLRWEMPREGWSRGRSAFPACIYVFTTDPSCSCLQLPVEMARCHSYVTSVPPSRRCLLGACLCGLFWTEGLVCPSDSVSFHLVKMGAWGGFEQRRERRRLSFWRASLVAHLIKNQPAVWECPVLFLGREDLLEKG